MRRIARQKLDDINAVNEGSKAGAVALTAADIEAFFGLAELEDDD